MKSALITGANGQDAFYLTKYLLEKNYVKSIKRCLA